MLNRVILMGRLTADPDYRTTQSGAAMVRFTLAVERDYTANRERQTDFLDITAWRSTADFVSKYFRKGQLVAVQGRIQVGSYTDREGNQRRSWDIVADQVYFAEPKRDGGQAGRQAAATTEPPSYYGHYDSADDFGASANEDLPF